MPPWKWCLGKNTQHPLAVKVFVSERASGNRTCALNTKNKSCYKWNIPQCQDKVRDSLLESKICYHTNILITLNVNTITGRSNETEEILERQKVDICRANETRRRGKSARKIQSKD